MIKLARKIGAEELEVKRSDSKRISKYLPIN
jgi:hypothetical protein